MGNATSLPAEASEGLRSLELLSGAIPLPIEDERWLPLLSFAAPLASWAEAEVQTMIRPYCSDLVYHNCQTYNFQGLFLHATRMAEKATRPGGGPSIQLANILCLVRLLLQEIMEQLNPAQLQNFLEVPHDAQSNGTTGDWCPVELQLVTSCLKLLSSFGSGDHHDGEPTNAAARGTVAGYLTQLSLLQLLLVVASTPLYCSNPEDVDQLDGAFLACLLEQERSTISRTVETLLGIFVAQQQAPLALNVYLPLRRHGILLGVVRAAASSILQLPYAATKLWLRQTETTSSSSPLALHAQLLLLALAFLPVGPAPTSPYRTALQRLQDSGGARIGSSEKGATLADDTSRAMEAGAAGLDAPRASFSELVSVLAPRLPDPDSVLMLYALMHRSALFFEYCLVRSDPELLLLPLLHALHDSCNTREPRSMGSADGTTRVERTTKSMMDHGELYMLLVVLLSLSSDNGWAAAIHRVQLPKSPPWLGARGGGPQSLGSVLFCVLLRAAHASTRRHGGDGFFQTNTMAVLCNLAPHATNLSAEASRRMVSLIFLLFRWCQRAGRRALGANTAVSSQEEEEERLQLGWDLLRMALESTSAVLEKALPSNAALIYALIYKADLFLELERDVTPTDPALARPITNIQLVVRFFTSALDSGANVLDEDAVKRGIEIALRSWRPAQLAPAAELHFQYEEDANSGPFFVPLVWARIISAASIHWNLASIKLFDPGEGGRTTE